MKRLLFGTLLFVIACGQEAPQQTAAVDTREAIEVRYVKSQELPVHSQPNATSPVIARFMTSESVSILSKKGDWLEVRTADGSGWAQASDLETSAEAAAATPKDDLTPRFRVRPEPVTQTTAHGELVLEANVSPNGDVLSVRTLSNSTGSMELEYKNTSALRNAKFFPIVKGGRRQEFIYEYRVHY